MTNSGFFFAQGKKDVVHLFSNIVRRQIGTRTPTVEYISSHQQILFMLLKGYVLPVSQCPSVHPCAPIFSPSSVCLLHPRHVSLKCNNGSKCLVCKPFVYRYESAEVALNCGMMLRECLRHEPLARTVLFSEEFYCFFRFVELSTFDIASDAFASFKVPCYILFMYGYK